MAYCYEFKGFVPVVPEETYVHPQAVLIGNVILGKECYIGPGASLRGDFGKIVIGDGANVQDNCIIHTFPGRDAVVETDGHIGHGAILHGCIVGQNALVGMNAVIMDGVELGAESIVGAQAFVRGETVIPPRSMVVGAPAKVIREVSEKEVAWKTRGTAEYQQLARDCLAGLKPVEPLREVETDRPDMAPSGVVSIQEARQQTS
ncbi:transferase hexapeptide repeat family protein [Sulfitobacter geojensis]|uniref:Transferase hexapeptide repeat family protein n=1 Tax=Sulfitobacter geojensis TaxID=1342299 RepID=A0AAE3B8C0_9RHOB|nr:transferase hexapeptide repeat family protein [Sulfitobacter geojensis]MBM1691239.1 transferase hexapeptide repeat family protein [Sulfitobacter geojensis]MBM1695305.1 transferase hexapeptide repeat family protein [Sulfitobacter geojensis]MBM1707405.1 transferase hexapeptide repeat family protein [Sulfitobacter geojensis]MBM1711555.1 transferase hexapeptide repeat family protein [Sulfitobacter geojensis]MBM1715530.1 transferase hexapeptide repeat family protein [Sulfitobacter geojensis]